MAWELNGNSGTNGNNFLGTRRGIPRMDQRSQAGLVPNGSVM